MKLRLFASLYFDSGRRVSIRLFVVNFNFSFSIGFCSGLKEHGISAQQKALDVVCHSSPMFLFRVSERFDLTVGLVLLPGLDNNYVPVGTPITIIRPDKSEIETKITSMFFGSNHITIEKSFSKNDVPIGSEVWANKSITYNLTHYDLTENKSAGVDQEIIFQHKVDPHLFMKLKLSGVVDVIDNLQQNKPKTKLRIEQTNSSYAVVLASQLKDEEIKTYPEVLIFSDPDCLDVVFRGVAKEITYRGERV